MSKDSNMYDTFVKSFDLFRPQFHYLYNYRGGLPDLQEYCLIMVCISIAMQFNRSFHLHHLHFQVS